MSEYETLQVESATVYTIVGYANWPEVRKYTVGDNEELADLLMSMRNPEHGEWVFDVEVEYV